MIVKAKLGHVHAAPRKVRLVIDLIRGKNIPTALAILMQVNKGSRDFVTKTLKSAISNAKQKGLTEDQLYISRIFADHGAMWKRYRAASFGRATPILKRTTHLTI